MSSDSPVYQVHYFKARGRGEVARILLEVAGANWTNVFIGTEAAPWPESKGNYAYGQVPGLKIINSDGSEDMIVQSYAIARFLGNQLGFEAPTPLARAYVDMFAEGIRDINECLAHAVYFSADKEAVTAKYLAEKFPVHLSGVEKALELCHAQIEDRPAVFTSSSLTWADVLAFVSLGWATSLGATTQAAPKVSALLEAVAAVPRIAAYLSAPHPWF